MIRAPKRLLGAPFVMYYNAKGSADGKESIGIALSDDLKTWRRYSDRPVLEHPEGITGDAQIQKMGDLYVMFYFGAFWKGKPYAAFNRFACSYDLAHWTDWTGDDLIVPSESYDNLFAHKSFVVKYKGVVYHFYCAVNGHDRARHAVGDVAGYGPEQSAIPLAPPRKTEPAKRSICFQPGSAPGHRPPRCGCARTGSLRNYGRRTSRPWRRNRGSRGRRSRARASIAAIDGIQIGPGGKPGYL